jgi:hypothetical protein
MTIILPVILAGLIVNGVVAFAVRSRASLRRTRRESGRCPECGYDLRGELAEGCPECGWNRQPEATA